MNKTNILIKFIGSIKRNKLLTKFIAYLFDYQNFSDHNYLFRLTKEESRVVIDIYDNISVNRFNRYIFNFAKSNLPSKTIKESNVYITYLNISNISNPDNKLYKLAYLFKLDKKDMLKYAKSFLPDEYLKLLTRIIK